MKLCIFNSITTIMLIIFGLHTPVFAEIRATFLPEAVIATDIITLGDLVAFEKENDTTRSLKHYVVDAAPPPGETKLFNTAAIIASLKASSDIKDIYWDGAAAVTVQRKSIRVSKKQLQQIIVDYLEQNRQMLPEGEIRFVSLRAPDEILLPYGEVSWKVTPSSDAIVDSSSFSLFFRINEAPAKHCVVRGRIEILRKIVVAKKTIQSKRVIDSDDLVMREQDITKVNDPCFALNDVLHNISNKTLRAGTPVEHDDITPPPIIKEGQMVTILARKGNLKITTSGIARKSGLIGDIIRVKNIQTKKLIYARIDKPGQVSVEF